jgi:hypothetical protein
LQGCQNLGTNPCGVIARELMSPAARFHVDLAKRSPSERQTRFAAQEKIA